LDAVLLAAQDAVAVLGGERGAGGEVLVHDVAPVAAGLGDEVEEAGVLVVGVRLGFVSYWFVLGWKVGCGR
jgi:hypothetical protein